MGFWAATGFHVSQDLTLEASFDQRILTQVLKELQTLETSKYIYPPIYPYYVIVVSIFFSIIPIVNPI